MQEVVTRTKKTRTIPRCLDSCGTLTLRGRTVAALQHLLDSEDEEGLWIDNLGPWGGGRALPAVGQKPRDGLEVGGVGEWEAGSSGRAWHDWGAWEARN